MVLATVASNHLPWVVSRRRHHAEDFSSRRLYGYDASDFSFQEPFAECLQIDVKTQCQVFARYLPSVVFTIVVFAFYPSVGITQEDLDSLLSAELLFVITLNAEFADIVACLIVLITLNVCR